MDTTFDFTFCYDCSNLTPYHYPDGKVLYYCEIGKVVIGQIKPKQGVKHPIPGTTRCQPVERNPKPEKVPFRTKIWNFFFGKKEEK